MPFCSGTGVGGGKKLFDEFINEEPMELADPKLIVPPGAPTFGME